MQVGRRLLSEGQDHHLYLTHLCVFQGRKAVLTFEVCPRTAGRRWRRYSEDDTGGVRRSVVRKNNEARGGVWIWKMKLEL